MSLASRENQSNASPTAPDRAFGLEINQCPASVQGAGGGLVVMPGSTTVLERVTICARLHQQDSDAQIAVVGPSGVTVQTFDLNGSGELARHVHRIDLFDDPGDYQIVVRVDGVVVNERSLSVSQPAQPQVRVRPPSNGRPGDSFLIDLAGWPSGEAPTVDIYRAGSRGIDFHYLDSIRGSIADANGRSEALLHTTGSETGVYCLVARGGPLECQLAVFKLA